MTELPNSKALVRQDYKKNDMISKLFIPQYTTMGDNDDAMSNKKSNKQ